MSHIDNSSIDDRSDRGEEKTEIHGNFQIG